MNRREDCLRQANECVNGAREQHYGSPERNFGEIGQLWTIYTGHLITAKDVALMMSLLKIVRAKNGSKDDNYIDLAGYAACAMEIDAPAPSATPTAMNWVCEQMHCQDYGKDACLDCPANIGQTKEVGTYDYTLRNK